MSLLEDRVIQDFGTPVDVSVLTVLFPFGTFGERLQTISVYCVNLDSTNPVTFKLEGSETKTNPDPEKTYLKSAEPGQQVSFDLEGGAMMVTNWRLSAETPGPGFPTAQVKYKIKAQIQRT